MELGVWDVQGMLREMSTEQFFLWRVYFTLDPFGEKRRDARIGTLAALIANTNRDPKRRSQPFKPEDFFWSLQEEGKRRSGARKPMMADDWRVARKILTVNYGG